MKMKPFVSIIDGQLKTGKTDRIHIKVKYEPKRTRAGVQHEPQLIPVRVNGKIRRKNISKVEHEYEL